MNIQGVVILKKELNKWYWKKSLFYTAKHFIPQSAENSFAFSSFVVFQSEFGLAGNLSRKWGTLTRMCISENPQAGLELPDSLESWSHKDVRDDLCPTWEKLRLQRLMWHPRKQIQ